MIEAELELDGCRACLHCITTEAEKYKEVGVRSYKERQDLLIKYRRIQEFQQMTIEQYIERALYSHQMKVTSVGRKLHDCIISEVKHFAKLSLPYLLFSTIDNALKRAVLDLSIHQLLAVKIRAPLAIWLSSFHFSSY